MEKTKSKDKEIKSDDKGDSNESDVTMVKLTNQQLYLIPKSEGFNRIMESLDKDVETDNRVYELFHMITGSAQAKALNDSMKKLVERFKTTSIPELMTIPDFVVLFTMDSGIEVERIPVKLSQVKISTRDRIELEFLFDFIDDRKGAVKQK